MQYIVRRPNGLVLYMFGHVVRQATHLCISLVTNKQSSESATSDQSHAMRTEPPPF